MPATPPHRVEQAGQADDGDAGHHRNVEFEPLNHDKNRGKLPERGEPAQPQDRIETDMAARMAKIGGSNFGHEASLRARGPDHKLAGPRSQPGSRKSCACHSNSPMNGPHDE